MINSNQTTNLDQIAFQVEQLKSFHLGCLRVLDRIQERLNEEKKPVVSVNSKGLPGGFGYELFGQWHRASTGTEILVSIFREFSQKNTHFPEQFAQKMRGVGRTRTYVAQKAVDLYRGRPDLAENSVKFTDGWFVGTNESNERKLMLIKKACEVMGIKYGVDLRTKMP